MIPTILLSAGYGTRLKPLTNNTPKCLIKIKGETILDFWINKLIKANYGPILINTHYLSEKVNAHINKSKYKKYIQTVNEKKLLGTAGTLIRNLDFYSAKDSLLMHADNYCYVDMKKFYKSHINRPKKSLMTMMTFETSDPINCGIVEIDNNKIVKQFYEKTKKNGKYANGAIYLLSKEIQNEIKKNYADAKDFSKDIVPNFLNRISIFHTKLNFFDIGTIKNYKFLNQK